MPYSTEKNFTIAVLSSLRDLCSKNPCEKCPLTDFCNQSILDYTDAQIEIVANYLEAK